MKLTDLDPRWTCTGDGRFGMGLSFLSPVSTTRIAVWFTNPVDGRDPITEPGRHLWLRTGDTFETLTLSPSIDASEWHGFIKGGDVTNC